MYVCVYIVCVCVRENTVLKILPTIVSPSQTTGVPHMNAFPKWKREESGSRGREEREEGREREEVRERKEAKEARERDEGRERKERD